MLKVIIALQNTVGQNAQVIAKLKTFNWILDDQGTLRTPKNLYLLPKDGMLGDELRGFGLSFHFLHPVLAAHGDAVEWLTGLGVRLFSRKEFLRGSVLPAIASGQVTQANALALGRFVFECRGFVENDDLATLRKLPLCVKGEA
ncbi:hypothetical protein [Nannocystis pusilla]|uniref:hypothetical protein n=1 Tax=Nannocystis pusilla TaxID=889268 RepID=UPI003B7643DD